MSKDRLWFYQYWCYCVTSLFVSRASHPYHEFLRKYYSPLSNPDAYGYDGLRLTRLRARFLLSAQPMWCPELTKTRGMLVVVTLVVVPTALVVGFSSLTGWMLAVSWVVVATVGLFVTRPKTPKVIFELQPHEGVLYDSCFSIIVQYHYGSLKPFRLEEFWIHQMAYRHTVTQPISVLGKDLMAKTIHVFDDDTAYDTSWVVKKFPAQIAEMFEYSQNKDNVFAFFDVYKFIDKKAVDRIISSDGMHTIAAIIHEYPYELLHHVVSLRPNIGSLVHIKDLAQLKRPDKDRVVQLFFPDVDEKLRIVLLGACDSFTESNPLVVDFLPVLSQAFTN